MLYLLLSKLDTHRCFIFAFTIIIPDSKETSSWISFFKEAGIPAGDAVHYAVTFVDNRIQMDMLSDLTKEYLHDMKISKLGDIICILKHAKATCEKVTRYRLFEINIPYKDVHVDNKEMTEFS